MAVLECPSLDTEQQITDSVYFDLKTDPNTDEISNFVNVQSFPLFKGDENVSLFDTQDEFVVGSDGVGTFEIEFSDRPVQINDTFVTLEKKSGNPSIDDYTVYAWGASVIVSGNPGSRFVLSAAGKIYKPLDTSTVTSTQDLSIREYGRIEYKVPDNHLIQNESTAQSIADSLIESYAGIRNDANISWPGNLMVQLTDPVELTEYKDDFIETNNIFYIVRQQIQYNGALDVQSNLRRA